MKIEFLMLQIQRSLLEYVKLSSLVNLIRSKVNITKVLMNTKLRGVPYDDSS